MTMQFVKAERKRSKLRLAIESASGGGKTHSSLLIAKGLGGKIALIDTEHGSGSLEAGKPGIPEYDTLELDPPFTPRRYIEAIKTGEQAGYDVIIIDSLSHEWQGEGGTLDMHDKATAASKSGNSYTAWKEVTPEHDKLVNAILQSKCHIIATMRQKQDYAQMTDDKGKTIVKKLGMAPVQREGMDYEFTVVLDLSQDHIATASKDRTSLFDGQHFKPSEETGKVLLTWLNSGKPEVIKQTETIVESKPPIQDEVKSEADKAFEKLESAGTPAFNWEWFNECLEILKWKFVTFVSWFHGRPEFKDVDINGSREQIISRLSKEQKEQLSKMLQTLVDMKQVKN